MSAQIQQQQHAAKASAKNRECTARHPILPFLSKAMLELEKFQRGAAMLSKYRETPVGEERPWKYEDCGEYGELGWELIVHLFMSTRYRVCYVKLLFGKFKTNRKKNQTGKKRGIFYPRECRLVKHEAKWCCRC